MLKTALAAICLLTLLATAYLTASLLILRPPRANDQQWAMIAGVIVAQGAVTLVALRSGSPKALHYAAAAGGIALAALGANGVYGTVSGQHFEGYALVLGSAMVVQGVFTLASFLRLQDLGLAGLKN